MDGGGGDPETAFALRTYPQDADVVFANPNIAHAFAKTTAFHFADEMGTVQVISILCQSDIELRHCDKARKITGGTALHTAADANQIAAIQASIVFSDHNSTAAA